MTSLDVGICVVTHLKVVNMNSHYFLGGEIMVFILKGLLCKILPF